VPFQSFAVKNNSVNTLKNFCDFRPRPPIALNPK
jgi:hypothetical protein